MLVLAGGIIVTTIVGLFLAGMTASKNPVRASSLSNNQARFLALAGGTTPVSEVPSVLPSGGVTVNKIFVLLPLSTAQATGIRMTATQAVTIAREYANAQPFTATALLARFTDINSVPPPGVVETNARIIQNVPAWIVTFTRSNPEDVIQGPKSAHPWYPTHFNIVINANTGTFVEGFFTA